MKTAKDVQENTSYHKCCCNHQDFLGFLWLWLVRSSVICWPFILYPLMALWLEMRGESVHCSCQVTDRSQERCEAGISRTEPAFSAFALNKTPIATTKLSTIFACMAILWFMSLHLRDNILLTLLFWFFNFSVNPSTLQCVFLLSPCLPKIWL